MPQSKGKGIAFGICIVFLMVYSISIYNISFVSGFNYFTFAMPFLEWQFYAELVICFILEGIVFSPVVERTVGRWKEAEGRPYFMHASMCLIQVAITAPIMSMIAMILMNGFTPALPLQWLTALVRTFPFALFILMVYIKPLAIKLFTPGFKSITAYNSQQLNK